MASVLREPGWTSNLATVPDISMNDVVSIIRKHSKVPMKHIDKGYKFFHGSYVHNIEVKVNERGCLVRAKCYRSMKKNESPHSLHMSFLNTKTIESQSCSCTAGKGTCSHVAALVYQLAHFKTLKIKSVPEIVSKTFCPQKYHIPPRTHGIEPMRLSDVKFVKPKPDKMQSEQCVCSTLYNPINTAFPDIEFMTQLKHIMHDSDIQLNQVLPDNFENLDSKDTAFGSALLGSTLAHQLPEPKSDGMVIRINDGSVFPTLPLDAHNLECPYSFVLTENQQLFVASITVTRDQAIEIEKLTRDQSCCPEWYKLKQKRLTSSKFKDIVIRKKDFESLIDRLTSSKQIQTLAMKHGIEHENTAVLEYATHKNVNVKPCGFIINPSAPYLGSSPDRIVYDPNEVSHFGVLEVKCPMKDTFKDAQFLKENPDGSYSLRKSHAYFLQVQGQMAITGLIWADFCVWTKNDMHIERIYFDNNLWLSTHEKLFLFLF